jgi:hypothetical protein
MLIVYQFFSFFYFVLFVCGTTKSAASLGGSKKDVPIKLSLLSNKIFASCEFLPAAEALPT